MAENNATVLKGQTALVTGAARRIGATLAQSLHAAGADIVLHYRYSQAQAGTLADSLNEARAGSAITAQGDLSDPDVCQQVADSAIRFRNRLDILINNASSFYPTPIGEISPADFDDLIGSNLRAPLFLTQAAAPALARHGGCIINIADIHGLRPRPGYPVYCAAKAGLIMLTRALAHDLAPDVRVNAIAPGSILWPEHTGGDDPALRAEILQATPLGRQGTPADIASAVHYLVGSAGFVTGEVLSVDGGRGL